MKIDTGIILYPSTRALAYLDIFKKNKLFPKEIITMGDWPFINQDLIDEDNKYNYSQKYFSLNSHIIDYIIENDIKHFHVSDVNINSKELVNLLDSKRCKEYIFTGGGILRSDVLSKNVKFIHVHPGNIINYRGSTCFYYSYLNQKLIECTTYYMSQNIDRGDVLNISRINTNLKINSDQKLFIDYILDPTIRALSLQRFLRLNADKKIHQINTFENSDCYLIHPALRYLFYKKINENYNPKINSGIFIDDK